MSTGTNEYRDESGQGRIRIHSCCRGRHSAAAFVRARDFVRGSMVDQERLRWSPKNSHQGNCWAVSRETFSLFAAELLWALSRSVGISEIGSQFGSAQYHRRRPASRFTWNIMQQRGDLDCPERLTWQAKNLLAAPAGSTGCWGARCPHSAPGRYGRPIAGLLFREGRSPLPGRGTER
jgi:hypothetical protein